MNNSLLESVQLDPKGRCSINYAKARAAIDLAIESRKERRIAKNIVIEHLQGHCENHSVTFPDNSKAKY